MVEPWIKVWRIRISRPTERCKLQPLGGFFTHAIHSSQPEHIHHSQNIITGSTHNQCYSFERQSIYQSEKAYGYWHWLFHRTKLLPHPSLSDGPHAKKMPILTAHHFQYVACNHELTGNIYRTMTLRCPSIMHIRRWETQRWLSRGWKLRRNPNLAPYSLIQGHNFLPDISPLTYHGSQVVQEIAV